jgi:diacylglycerol O-acyltransferase / wax synthase
MTDYYPLSIVVHGVALNITVQSHVDQLCFGLIACRRAVPDVHELGAQLQRAMASLRALSAAAEAKTIAAVVPAPTTPAAAKEGATKTKRRRSAQAPRLRVVPAKVASTAAKRKARTAASR